MSTKTAPKTAPANTTIETLKDLESGLDKRFLTMNQIPHDAWYKTVDAVFRIHDTHMYTHKYTSLTDYLKQDYIGCSRQTFFALAKSGKVINMLKEAGFEQSQLPSTRAMCVQLFKVCKEKNIKLVTVWKKVLEHFGNKRDNVLANQIYALFNDIPTVIPAKASASGVPVDVNTAASAEKDPDAGTPSVAENPDRAAETPSDPAAEKDPAAETPSVAENPVTVVDKAPTAGTPWLRCFLLDSEMTDRAAGTSSDPAAEKDRAEENVEKDPAEVEENVEKDRAEENVEKDPAEVEENVEKDRAEENVEKDPAEVEENVEKDRAEENVEKDPAEVEENVEKDVEKDVEENVEKDRAVENVEKDVETIVEKDVEENVETIFGKDEDKEEEDVEKDEDEDEEKDEDEEEDESSSEEESEEESGTKKRLYYNRSNRPRKSRKVSKSKKIVSDKSKEIVDEDETEVPVPGMWVYVKAGEYKDECVPTQEMKDCWAIFYREYRKLPKSSQTYNTECLYYDMLVFKDKMQYAA